MNKLFYGFILSGLFLLGCQQKRSPSRGNRSTIQSFQIRVMNNSFVQSESPVILLTETNIRVLKGQGADSLQFIIPVGFSDTLSRISEISPLALNKIYSNDCIADGLQLTVVLTKGDTTQTVHINNFYQPDLGIAIEYLNAHVPEKFRILYDRNQLEADYKKCQEAGTKRRPKA
jgi:hypothetical protein